MVIALLAVYRGSLHSGQEHKASRSVQISAHLLLAIGFVLCVCVSGCGGWGGVRVGRGWSPFLSLLFVEFICKAGLIIVFHGR